MAGFNRILKNFGAMFAGRLLNVVQQVLVPPLFAARYSLAMFGEWGALSSAVGAVSMLNFGVQTYMNQDLAIRYNSGDLGDYRVRQSTSLRLLLGGVITAAALGLLVFLLPLSTLLKLDISNREAQWTLYLLGCQILVGILLGYFGGIFMGVALAHRGSHWNNSQSLLGSLSLLIGILLHLPFPLLAALQLAATLLTVVLVLADLRRKAPDLFPTLRYWDGTAVSSILKPSGYFGLIELSTFLTFQVPVVIMQRFLGPIAVAGFILMRQIFSMCRQILAMFTQSMGPEITVLYGKRDWKALSRLYQYSERFIFFLIPLVNTGVLMLSPVILAVWMRHKGQLFSPVPYMLAAAISMVISLKEHKLQFQFSTNTHEELARIMFAGYIGMIVGTFLLMPRYGVVGFLWLWLAVEILQMAFIVRLNVQLFAHVESVEEAIELANLRRLIAICVPALALALLLLRRTSTLGIFTQAAIAIGSGGLVAAIGWHLFHIRSVFSKIRSQFSHRFSQPTTST